MKYIPIILILGLMLLSGCCERSCIKEIEEIRHEECLKSSYASTGDFDNFDYNECIKQRETDTEICATKCS